MLGGAYAFRSKCNIVCLKVVSPLHVILSVFLYAGQIENLCLCVPNLWWYKHTLDFFHTSASWIDVDGYGLKSLLLSDVMYSLQGECCIWPWYQLLVQYDLFVNLEFLSVCFTCPFKGLQIVLAFENDIWRDNGSGWYLVTFTYQWNGDRQTFQECMVSGSSHLTWAGRDGLGTAVNCQLKSVLFFPTFFFVFCFNFYGFY